MTDPKILEETEAELRRCVSEWEESRKRLAAARSDLDLCRKMLEQAQANHTRALKATLP